MTDMPVEIGTDHCRVVPPGNDNSLEQQMEFCRHAFVYEEVAARLPGNGRILEVGCGAGYGTRRIADKVAWVIGTDFSFQAVAYARQSFPAGDFCQASGTSLPFSDGEFDAVISFQVIEHVVDAAGFIRELHRVLKPGGKLYMTTPNRLLRLLPFQKPWNPYHVKEYSGRELRQLVRGLFPEFDLQGVMARPDLMRLEKRRVSQNPLVKLAVMVSGRFGKRFERDESTLAVDAAPVSLNDFYLTGDVDRSLDLFVMATRENL